jgi:hypothetical protein
MTSEWWRSTTTWYNQLQLRRERLSILVNQMKLTTDPSETIILKKRVLRAERVLTHPSITLTVMGTIIVGYIVSLYTLLWLH